MDFSEARLARRWSASSRALILIVSLFLEWYSLETARASRATRIRDWVCGEGELSCTGFETFPILRWLLIAAAAAPLILAYIVAAATAHLAARAS